MRESIFLASQINGQLSIGIRNSLILNGHWFKFDMIFFYQSHLICFKIHTKFIQTIYFKIPPVILN